MDIHLDDILSNRVAFESSDVDVVRTEISRYFKPHDIQFLDGRRHQLKTSLRRTKVGSIAINFLEYGGNVVIDPGKLEHFYLIHLALAGESEVRHDGKSMTISSRQAAVIAPHRPYRFAWQPQTSVLAIQIPRQRLHAHLRDITGIVSREEIDFDIGLNLDDPAAHGFSELLRYLLTDANNPRGLISDPICAEPLECALMTALLQTQPGSHHYAMSAAASCAAPAHVIRAESFMLNNLQRSIKLDELAKISNVTARTLTSGFRRFRGDTPARYFLALRLAEARRTLLASDGGTTVSDIAFEIGFHHLSSFAAAYRQRYDETPSQTLHRFPVGNSIS